MRWVHVGIVGVVAVVAGATGLAISGGVGAEADGRRGAESSGDAGSQGEALTTNPMAAGDPCWGNDALPPAPAPPGKKIVAFNDGGVPGLAGYIDDQGTNGWDEPDPVLDLGSGRYEARGVEVTEADRPMTEEEIVEMFGDPGGG